MDELVSTFEDEWKVVANNPERQKLFRQFVNTVSLFQNSKKRQLTFMLRASGLRPLNLSVNEVSPDLLIGRRRALPYICETATSPHGRTLGNGVNLPLLMISPLRILVQREFNLHFRDTCN